MDTVLWGAFADELEKVASPMTAAQIGQRISDAIRLTTRAGRTVAPVALLPAAGAVAGYKASEQSPVAGAAVGGLGALAALINLRSGGALPITKMMTRPRPALMGHADDLARMEENALRYGLGEYFMYPGMALGAAAGASLPGFKRNRPDDVNTATKQYNADVASGTYTPGPAAQNAEYLSQLILMAEAPEALEDQEGGL